MPVLRVQLRDGERLTLEAKSNQSVMEALRDNGIADLEALCGGSCACATCHVFIDPAFVNLIPTMGAAENELLDISNHRRATSRLSCQVTFTAALDGLAVEIAPQD